MDGMRLLLDDLRDVEMIDRDEQARLARHYAETGDQESRHKLILSCAPWAIAVAKKFGYVGHRNRLDQTELCSMALHGLIEAVDCYNPDRGALTGWVDWYVRRVILKYLEEDAEVIHIPNYTKDTTKITDHRKRQVQAVKQGVVSLSQVIRSEGGEVLTLEDVLQAPDEVDKAAAMDLATKKEWLVRNLARLPEREQYVMRSRLAGETLQALADILNITRERVRQIEVDARGKLIEWAKHPEEEPEMAGADTKLTDVLKNLTLDMVVQAEREADDEFTKVESKLTAELQQLRETHKCQLKSLGILRQSVLARLGQAAKVRREPTSKATNITRVIDYLRSNGPASPKQIAEALSLPVSAASSAISNARPAIEKTGRLWKLSSAQLVDSPGADDEHCHCAEETFGHAADAQMVVGSHI